jgi:galactofuranosylgalactofuranosylrhamnosyl-N-acetylglucosaminyl-diphospho-decaprenol beta-1,5/1,6-galactofuranosyltransferase
METESILRTITFGDLCRRPSIVGGHMFSLFRKTQLHSFGEIINRWRFWWMSPLTVENDWDFAARNLRSTRWLHRRIDADFNPWFFCLIPTEVVKEIGLGLPLFIKWDDSEYGVRAQAAGFPTISMPGAAVWHVPWTDKNDALTGRPISTSATASWPHCCTRPSREAGGWCARASTTLPSTWIVMHYSTVELRLKALEDVLAGPHRLHPDLATKLPEFASCAVISQMHRLKAIQMPSLLYDEPNRESGHSATS